MGNSEEWRQWLNMRGLESETREQREREISGAEGSALTPSITHLMRRYGAIVLLLGGNRRDLDFTVWSLCFPLLGWHLFSLFAALSLSSPLAALMCLFLRLLSPTFSRLARFFGSCSLTFHYPLFQVTDSPMSIRRSLVDSQS